MKTDSPDKTILTLNRITRQFGDFTAVNKATLEIKDGEFFTIVGPSGCGKTTLLRMLVGLDQPTSGDLYLRDRASGESRRVNDIPANKRPTCMVFQSLALFPHMSVGRNIDFPMKLQGKAESERQIETYRLMKLLQLPRDYYFKKINQCSGGERQRVALARALAFNPDILFFDEPLSAIDARLRKILQKELKNIQRQTGKTFVYVTHSLEEAMLMSDRVAILNAGNVEQIGTPSQIYDTPRNSFVAEFMGEVNLFDVIGEPRNLLRCRKTGAQFKSPRQVAEGKDYTLLVRPEAIHFIGEESEEYDNQLVAKMSMEYSLGSRLQYQVKAAECEITVERLANETGVVPSESSKIAWKTDESILLES
jgi:spermidine/putrescine transport system ATP-binding protein